MIRALAYNVTTCAPEQSCLERNTKCAESISDQQVRHLQSSIQRFSHYYPQLNCFENDAKRTE